MGLPSRWTHPPHGVCLTLHAALAHLRAHGIPAEAEAGNIRATPAHGQRVTLAPVETPLGKGFPLTALDALHPPTAP
ncbi:MAG: hypothetical protein MUC99_07140 [Anaerolineae bacterium]|jgi:hypothetical protein|nr:hypothetical protein [Anaerolineae bacterium]